MKQIDILIYQWTHDSTKYLFIYNTDIPFDDAPQFLHTEWLFKAKLRLLSPLYRPIPPGYQLYLAARLDRFPYNTTQIIEKEQLFTPFGKGVFFLANKHDLDIIKDITKMKITFI